MKRPCEYEDFEATLDKNPGWVDVALDCKNAFNSITRSAFMRVIAERFPGLWDWAYTLYGAPTELYVRRDGMPPEIIRSLCGTRQGCPLGAQFFCLGLHPLLLAIQSMLGDRGVVVAYCDDIHHDCAWYGSWAAVWHYMRAWVAPLRGMQLAQLGHGRHVDKCVSG